MTRNAGRVEGQKAESLNVEGGSPEPGRGIQRQDPGFGTWELGSDNREPRPFGIEFAGGWGQGARPRRASPVDE